jgi:hypothetical protein
VGTIQPEQTPEGRLALRAPLAGSPRVRTIQAIITEDKVVIHCRVTTEANDSRQVKSMVEHTLIS